jgi:hypothetical protein
MSVEIKSIGTNLSVKVGDNTRILAKTLVREVVILRNNTLKLDIGGGALRNIFLPIVDITLPAHTDNVTLLEAVNTMLVPAEVAIQNELDELQNVVEHLQTLVGNMNPAFLQEPMFIDEGNPRAIYTGYAVSGSQTNEAKFAIMRTTITDEDIIVNEWANGNLNATNIWDNREGLTYGIVADRG